jgi:hypothetical protein
MRPLSRLALLLLALASIPTPAHAASGTPAPTSATTAPPENAVWRLLSGPVDPPQTSGHAAVYDSRRHRMIVITGAASEVWTLTLASPGAQHWIRVPIAGPDYPAWRVFMSATYDSTHDRVLMYGGQTTAGYGPTDYYDLWSLSLSDPPHWTKIVSPDSSPGIPGPAAFDLDHDRLIVTGPPPGTWNSPQPVFMEAWSLALDGARWTKLATTGIPPTARAAQQLIYDPFDNRLVMFGGILSQPRGWTNSTWVLSLSGTPVWQRIVPINSPPTRSGTVVVLDRARRQLVLTGGYQTDVYGWVNDTWTLPLPADLSDPSLSWTKLQTTGGIPPNDLSAAIYWPEGDRVVQFGGEGAGNLAFAFDPSNADWSSIDTEVHGPFPSRREGPALVVDREQSQLLLYGNGLNCGTDFWGFPLEGADDWAQLGDVGYPINCRPNNFVSDPLHRRLLAITGGDVRAREPLDQVWALPFDGPRVWTKLTTLGPNPGPRFEYGLAYDSARDRVLMFGGGTWYTPVQDMAEDNDEVWELALSSFTWRRLAPVNSPGARRRSSVQYDAVGDRLVIVAGANSGFRSSYPRSDCWALSLGGDSLRWAQFAPDLPSTGSPFDDSPRLTALDPLRNRLVYWDGAQSVFTLPLGLPDAWQPVQVSGDQPLPRDYFGLAYDAGGDRLITFGGTTGSLLGDLHALRFSDEVSVLLLSPAGFAPSDPGPRRPRLLNVAILGSPSFSVDSIIPESVTLGGAPALGTAGPFSRMLRDLNGDGHDDLVLWFESGVVNAPYQDSPFRLWGRTPHFAIRGIAQPDPRRLAEPQAPSATDATVTDVLSLNPVTPSVSGMTVRFSLASAAPARLEVYDIAGRQLQSRDVGAFGPGQHVLQLGGGELSPGVYLVRLSQDGRQLVARGILIR